MSRSLSERLKSETQTLHTAAERSTFMRVLLRGRMQRSAYCAMLRNLHAIYAVLEPALTRHCDHPLVAPVYMPVLFRLAALAHDLQTLHGPRWMEDLALQPAAMAYVQRVQWIDSAQPGLLLPHAYVRYLGDLSGGQLLRRIVGESPTLGGMDAVAFYDFGDAAATRDRMQVFRDGLAAVNADAAQQDALIAEARLAFGLHAQLFDELAADGSISIEPT